MPQRNRRTLSALTLTAALVLALPSPSQAASPWDWDPARLAAQACSWLEQLGFLTGEATMPVAQWEKEGSLVDPEGKPIATTSAPPIEGSGPK